MKINCVIQCGKPNRIHRDYTGFLSLLFRSKKGIYNLFPEKWNDHLSNGRNRHVHQDFFSGFFTGI